MTTLPSSWATQEPHALLWYEQVINAAVSIGCVAYGLHIAVFATCSYYLITAKRFSWFYQIYITILFILASTNIACNVRFSELSWIDERNYPGGEAHKVHLEQDNLPVHIVGDAAANTITLMVDVLLIYRCYIIWASWKIVVLPSMMLVASTTMSILRTIAAAQPAGSIFAASAVRFGLPYWALSMTLNMLVTITIVTRLVLARRAFQASAGQGYRDTYSGISAMLVESALPYAIVSLILIILYARGNTAEILFVPLLPHIQCIAPELIIIRVRRGRAWTKETSQSLSTLRFDQQGDHSGTAIETTGLKR
ncbi:hypothetical protein BDQ17DRAFT_1245852 [Cyathus striatus]|nr:hypothetical protein BDQ17DRAFT_1245852 [Cyathus striatus]